MISLILFGVFLHSLHCISKSVLKFAFKQHLTIPLWNKIVKLTTKVFALTFLFVGVKVYKEL